jgi:hypothetical protein
VLEALESCTGYFINTGDPIMLSSALRPNAATAARSRSSAGASSRTAP